MKSKRLISAVLAGTMLASSVASLGVSAEEASLGDLVKTTAVTGKAGITFQTNGNYTYRDIKGTSGDHGVFPQKEVGCGGGANGFSTINAGDVSINGDGTYKVSIPTSGIIDIEPDLRKPANKKNWYIDEEKGVTRMGSAWSMLGSYEPPELEAGAEIPAPSEWVLNPGNTAFNMLCVSTDIPAYYNKDTHKCYLDKAKTKEVKVSNVVVDMAGKTYNASGTAWKDDVGYVCISLINAYAEDGSMIDKSAFITEDGTISVSFKIEGLGKKASPKKSISKASVKLSKTKVAYRGKAIKPGVSVKLDGKTLKKNTDYTVSYKNNKKTGKATVIITGKGKYTGKITKSFYIVPKKPAKPSVKAVGGKKLKVTLKRDKMATGYQIQCSTDKKFKKSVKTSNLTKNTSVKKTFKSLKKGKKYYVRSRSYIKVGKKKYYGEFSAIKAARVK